MSWDARVSWDARDYDGITKATEYAEHEEELERLALERQEAEHRELPRKPMSRW